MVRLAAEQCAIIGANIRAFRQRQGWSQARLAELIGWDSASTVCAAEGHRAGRQRRFRTWEIERLAAIFGISPWQLTTRCANCGGYPPLGFACLACGATPSTSQPASTGHPAPHGHTAAGR